MADLENVHLTAGDVEKIAKWLNASHTRSAMIQGRPGNIALLPNLHYRDLVLFRNGLPVDIHTVLDEVEEMEPPKKYALFAYLDYERGGGWSDFRGMFETPDDAFRYVESHLYQTVDFYEVVDLSVPKEVEHGYVKLRGKGIVRHRTK